MNEELISRWNARITDKDDVYHLGDFCMSRKSNRWIIHLDRLKGRIHLVKGNHDKDKTIKTIQERINKKKFVWVKDYFYLKTQYHGKKFDLVLMHYPLRTWDRSHYGVIHCHGHQHGTGIDPIKHSLDIGVDTHQYYPYTIDEIVESIFTRDCLT